MRRNVLAYASGLAGTVGNRGKQLRRVLRLRRMLVRPEGVTATQAGRELGCSRRTIYRDLEALQAEGFSVYSDADGQGGRWRLGREEAVPFTHDELAALWIAHDSLARLKGTALAKGARTALDKLRASLSRDERRRLEGLSQGSGGAAQRRAQGR